MPKWIGNRFGSVVPIGPGSNAGPAVYSLFDQYYASRESGWSTISQGMTATGGAISDYTDGSTVYRSHVFTSSGTFAISDLGDIASTVDYLIVAGGGGGGAWVGGGAGAGGMMASHPDMPSPRRGSAVPVSTSPGSYTVVIGGGGTGWRQAGEGAATIVGTPGTDTVALSKRAAGGGRGGDWNQGYRESGGSGGGGGGTPTGAAGNLYSPTSPAYPGPAPGSGTCWW